MWETTKWSLFAIGSPSDQNISKNLLKFINSHFYYSGNYYTHKLDPVPYQLSLSKNKKRFILHQSRLPTYLEYENFIKSIIQHYPEQSFSYPPKIKPYTMRFELLGFITWHSFTKNQSFSANQYSSIYKDYCKLVHSNLIQYNDYLLCGRQYDIQSELINYPQLPFRLPKHIKINISTK